MIEIRHNAIPKRRFDSGDRRHDLFLAIHYIQRESGVTDLLNSAATDEWDIIEVVNPGYYPPDAALWWRYAIRLGP